MMKDDALYVKACVIPANEEDMQGDSLSSEDIKRIFTSFNNQDSFEIYHHGEQIDGITLLENYINKAGEPVGDRTAPIGSWLIIMKVTNPTIKEMVLSHAFEGVSLSSTVKPSCAKNLPDITTYSNVKDMECVTPRFISLVGKLGTDEGPANGYPLEVMNYTTYIKKSKNGGKNLEVKDIVNALKDLVNSAESVETTTNVEAPVILKNDEPKKIQEDECPKVEKESKPVVQKEEATEEEPENDDSVSLEALEARIEALEKAIESLQKPEEEEEEDEVKPKINKNNKRTVITEDPEPVIIKSFNERTGRDSFGRKIR